MLNRIINKNRKFISIILITIILLGSIVSGSISVYGSELNTNTEELEPLGHVIMTVEKHSLNQGYYRDPIEVPFYEGDNGASLLTRLIGEGLYENTGDIDSSFYLSSIYDETMEEIDFPQHILDNADGIENTRDTEWLGEFDYTYMSGWMYAVNGWFPNYGFSDYRPKDGDVIRTQFTVFGYGADIGANNIEWGVPDYKQLSNKYPLTRTLGKFNALDRRDELLENKSISDMYDKAYNIAADIDAEQELVDMVEREFRLLVNGEIYEDKEEDKTILRRLIDDSLAYNASDYSVEHWKEFYSVLEIAKEIESDHMATRNEINEVTIKLNNRIQNLKNNMIKSESENKENISELIKLIEELKDKDEYDIEDLNILLYRLDGIERENISKLDSNIINTIIFELIGNTESIVEDMEIDKLNSGEIESIAIELKELTKNLYSEDIKILGIKNGEVYLSNNQKMIIDDNNAQIEVLLNGDKINSHLNGNRLEYDLELLPGNNHISIVFVNKYGYKNSKYLFVSYNKNDSEETPVLDESDNSFNTNIPGGGGGNMPGGENLNNKNKDTNIKEKTINKIDDKGISLEKIELIFEDLEGFEWANEDINRLVKANIIKGKTKYRFGPGDNITRGEFAVMTSRLLGLEEVNKNYFKDIKSDKYYSGAVNALYEKGIVNGTSETIFKPEDSITREEAAKIIEKLIDIDYDKKTNLNDYKDKSNISNWAEDSINLLIGLEIISGYPDKTLRPKDNITRAETSVIFSRTMDFIK